MAIITRSMRAITIPATRPSLSPRVGAATTAAPGPITAKRSSADDIRSRLLFKLGIYDPNFTNASIHDRILRCESSESSDSDRWEPPTRRRCDSSISSRRSALSSLDDQSQGRRRSPSSAAAYTIPLKLAQDSQDNSPHREGGGIDSEPPVSISTRMETSEMFRHRRSLSPLIKVRFDPAVAVATIPSHRSYPPQVHAAMHASKDEMAWNTMRNTREFVYEGWEWQDAVEEDGMFVCTVSGEYVHPAHVVAL